MTNILLLTVSIVLSCNGENSSTSHKIVSYQQQIGNANLIAKDSILVNIQDHIYQAFVQGVMSGDDSKLKEIENRLDKLYQEEKQNLILYWKSYLKYYQAILFFKNDSKDKSEETKLPNTKIKLLQQMLAKAIGEFKKVNKVKGIDFSKKMQSLVEIYNEHKEDDILRSEVFDEMAESLTKMIMEVQKAYETGEELGIGFEEKAFYDILNELAIKYDLNIPMRS